MTRVEGRKSKVSTVMVFIVSLSRAASVATRLESSATARLILLSLCATRLKA